MELTKYSKCDRCKGVMKGRPNTLAVGDAAVLACMACGLYGVAGDDRVFDRKELGDVELERELNERAARLIRIEAGRQTRYQDAEPGKLWA